MDRVGMPPALSSRLMTIRAQFEAEVRRYEGVVARSRELMEESRQGRSRREILHESAYARLQARIETMPVIEQAKGVLMAQRGIGPEEAFDILRRASQQSNVKVNMLAARIVDELSNGTRGPGSARKPQAPAGRGRAA